MKDTSKGVRRINRLRLAILGKWGAQAPSKPFPGMLSTVSASDVGIMRQLAELAKEVDTENPAAFMSYQSRSIAPENSDFLENSEAALARLVATGKPAPDSHGELKGVGHKGYNRAPSPHEQVCDALGLGRVTDTDTVFDGPRSFTLQTFDRGAFGAFYRAELVTEYNPTVDAPMAATALYKGFDPEYALMIGAWAATELQYRWENKRKQNGKTARGCGNYGKRQAHKVASKQWVIFKAWIDAYHPEGTSEHADMMLKAQVTARRIAINIRAEAGAQVNHIMLRRMSPVWRDNNSTKWSERAIRHGNTRLPEPFKVVHKGNTNSQQETWDDENTRMDTEYLVRVAENAYRANLEKPDRVQYSEDLADYRKQAKGERWGRFLAYLDSVDKAGQAQLRARFRWVKPTSKSYTKTGSETFTQEIDRLNSQRDNSDPVITAPQALTVNLYAKMKGRMAITAKFWGLCEKSLGWNGGKESRKAMLDRLPAGSSVTIKDWVNGEGYIPTDMHYLTMPDENEGCPM